MTQLTLETLDLAQTEYLMVSYHKPTGEWWAHIGRDHGPKTARATGAGPTPIAALGEMLIGMGVKPEGVN